MLRTRRPEVYGDPPYPHARGAAVAGYHRDGTRGKILESVRIVAEPDVARAAIEAINTSVRTCAAEDAPAPPSVTLGNEPPIPQVPDVEVLSPAPRPRVPGARERAPRAARTGARRLRVGIAAAGRGVSPTPAAWWGIPKAVQCPSPHFHSRSTPRAIDDTTARTTLGAVITYQAPDERTAHEG